MEIYLINVKWIFVNPSNYIDAIDGHVNVKIVKEKSENTSEFLAISVHFSYHLQNYYQPSIAQQCAQVNLTRPARCRLLK